MRIRVILRNRRTPCQGAGEWERQAGMGRDLVTGIHYTRAVCRVC